MLYYLANDSRILNMSLDLKLVDGRLFSIHHLQTDGRTDKKMDRPTQIHLTNNMLGFAYIQITLLILIELPPILLYYLANDSRILNMSLDLKLVDGKLVSIHHLQTDGRTNKKMDRDTQIHLRY